MPIFLPQSSSSACRIPKYTPCLESRGKFRIRRYRKMKFILHERIKILRRLAVLVVIATALLKNVRDFLIRPPLARTDFFKQLVKIIFPELSAVFEERFVQNKAFRNVFAQRFRRPLTKLRGFFAVHAVAQPQ